jgi:hypothetical protein
MDEHDFNLTVQVRYWVPIKYLTTFGGETNTKEKSSRRNHISNKIEIMNNEKSNNNSVKFPTRGSECTSSFWPTVSTDFDWLDVDQMCLLTDTHQCRPFLIDWMSIRFVIWPTRISVDHLWLTGCRSDLSFDRHSSNSTIFDRLNVDQICHLTDTRQRG